MNIGLLNRILKEKGKESPDKILKDSYITSAMISKYFVDNPIHYFDTIKRYDELMSIDDSLPETDIKKILTEFV